MDDQVGLRSVNEARQTEKKRQGRRTERAALHRSKLLASHWTHFNSSPEKT